MLAASIYDHCNFWNTATVVWVVFLSLTSQLWISNTVPLPTAVPQACALHHVTHDIMALVPFVSYAVHRSIIGGTQLLMGYVENNMKKWGKTKKCCVDVPAVCAFLMTFCLVHSDLELSSVNAVKCWYVTAPIESLLSHDHKA